MMLAKSVLADFMSGLDSNISIILYRLASGSLDEAIRKAKIIKIGQINVLGAIQYNAKIAQLKQENRVLQQQLE